MLSELREENEKSKKLSLAYLYFSKKSSRDSLNSSDLAKFFVDGFIDHFIITMFLAFGKQIIDFPPKSHRT